MIKQALTISIFLALFLALLPPPSIHAAPTAEQLYYKADQSYKNLRKSPRKQKYRQFWLDCIKRYQAVYRKDPGGPWAAAGMYRSGELYYELYKRSYLNSDKQEALDILERVIKRYPKSRYRPRAAETVRKITRNRAKPATKKPVTKKPASVKRVTVKQTPDTKTAYETDSISNLITGSQKAPAAPSAGRKAAGPVNVTNVRHWSNPSYTRVVIDATHETGYKYRLLNRDTAINKPQRLYVDLANSELGNELDKVIPINDNLLENVRAGQYTRDDVRVVIDIKSFKRYKIFSLRNPFRIVIDVWGEAITAEKPEPKPPQKPADPHIPPSAIAKQLALGVRTIVIDPGHGGRDYGAPGYLKGVHEKKIIIRMARKLAEKIRKKLKCNVVLTRENDRFLTLEERTAIANTQNADLFISLHTNAHKDRRAYGIETYFLNLATDDDSIRVAAMENATSTKNISDLQAILTDLMQNAKINESSRLATYVQDAMVGKLKSHYNRIKNKGVKQAPFYVLLGAQMPAILIETGFISNPRECKRLNNAKYQNRLCEAIVNGIQKYMKETNPTAFRENLTPQGSKG